ncbi:PD-(D/E)XK nuclease family protein, partial [Methylopila henanensis]
VPPPEMVANLRADNIDGFLAPDPVNQRAVYDGVGLPPAGADAEELGRFLDELADAAASADPIAPRSFPGVVEALMAGRTVRPRRDRHPRLRILGPLEARLISVDRIVLGGLNDGVWPPAPQSDAWINRPLRAELGLAQPERRIGLSAHDFCQLLGAREAVLTRAAKAGGAPTIPSRWLQRTADVAPADYAAAEARGARYAVLGERLDDAGRDPPARPPEPRPARELRPTRLSVTAVETWLRDPYSIYARHVLRLEELGSVGPAPGPAELGDVVHAALEAFLASGVAMDDTAAREALLRLGREAFGDLAERDEVRLMWLPRFERIADWTLAFERGRNAQVTTRHAERTGAFAFPTVAGREFTLNVRADRIDLLADGSAVLIDYKTGRAATARQALAGFAPQLPLEGAILREGGFEGIAPKAGALGGMMLLRLTGRDPAGEIIDIRHKTEPLEAVADEALKRFRQVVDRFENPDEPYRSLSHPQFLSRPEGPYAHLARVKEWSATGGAAEGDGGEA